MIKDLKVKDSSVNLKDGTEVKKIRLTDNTDEIDCKVDGMRIVLKKDF